MSQVFKDEQELWVERKKGVLDTLVLSGLSLCSDELVYSWMAKSFTDPLCWGWRLLFGAMVPNLAPGTSFPQRGVVVVSG